MDIDHKKIYVQIHVNYQMNNLLKNIKSIKENILNINNINTIEIASLYFYCIMNKIKIQYY